MEGRIRPSGLTEVTSRVDALPPHQPTPHHKESPPIPFKIAAPIIIATLGLAACGPISAKTSTPEGAFPTNAPTGEVVPANPTAIVAPAEAPTSAPTKVPEVVAPDVVDYTVDQLFIDAQYGYRYILSGNILSPMDNVPLEDANAAQWVLNAENNAQLVKERTGAAPSATLLFTNGKKDAESRNAAMSFSGNSIMWPSYSEGQSTFLSASPSEYWFPVQADQSKVTYQKVNLPAGYTSDDVRMGWVGDNQSVELAAKGGKGMLVFNPTTQEWREMNNVPTTELLTSVIAPFMHANGDKINIGGNEVDATKLIQEIVANPSTYVHEKTINGTVYSILVVNETPLAIENGEGSWKKLVGRDLADPLNLVFAMPGLSYYIEDPAQHEILANANQLVVTYDLDQSVVYGKFTAEDWRSVLDNWDSIQKDLDNKKLPTNLPFFWDQADFVLKFAEDHNMTVKAQCLLSGGQSIPESILRGNFSKDELKKLLEFMTSVTVLRNADNVDEWHMEDEQLIADMNKEGNEDFGFWMREVGLVDGSELVARTIKKFDPDARIAFAETYIFEDQVGTQEPELRRRFFAFIDELQSRKVPLDGVDVENGVWAYNPPRVEYMKQIMEEIKARGLDIEAPEALVLMTPDTYPFWYEPVTKTRTVTDPVRDQAQVFKDIMQTYIDEGARGIGFGDVGDKFAFLNFSGQESANPSLFDDDNNAKLAYYEVLKVLYGAFMKK